MALGRQIIACLALLAAGFFLLACGSSDEPDLEGEPFSETEQTDLTKNLGDLQAAFDQGDCDEALKKLGGLQQAVEDMPEERDVELRAQLTEAFDKLGTQIEEDEACQVEEPTTSSSTIEEVDPTTTDPPETTSSTDPPETTSSTTDPETNTPPEEKPPPTTPPGNDDDNGGSGGTAPGGGFEADRRPPPQPGSKAEAP